jgi:phage terminase large subunit-like protein
MEDGTGVHILIEPVLGATGFNTIDNYGGPATGSKEERTNPVNSQAEAGNIYLVRGPCVGAFLGEAESYP